MHLNTGFSSLRAFGKSLSISCRTLDCQLSNEELFLSLVAVGFISFLYIVKSETRTFIARGADTSSKLTPQDCDVVMSVFVCAAASG